MSMNNTLITTIVAVLEDMQAIDTKIIEVSKKSSFTDHMIITTGRSGRHANAIAENVIKALKDNDLPIINVAGRTNSNWILIDSGDCITHVMQPDTRSLYNLEELWQDA